MLKSAVATARLSLTLLASVWVAVATPSVAWSASGADVERIRSARAHYEQAVSHYNLDEFAPALAEFREAYRLKPDPSFLFNIAQCHRRLGENEEALDFYRKYLRSMPDAPNRADVERTIAELHAREVAPEAAPATLPAAPTTGATPEPSAEVAPPGRVTPPTATSQEPQGIASASLVAPVPSPPEPRPLYRRWWFWTALGAVAVGAVIASVALASSSEAPYSGTLTPGVVTLQAH
jgi:tetratricopeptide (TPR) repeat protein